MNRHQTTQPCDHVTAADLAAVLREAHQPTGHRLGILTTAAAPPDVLDVARSVITDRGSEPRRRLAVLRPRVGESTIRLDDVTDFVARYGHEYTCVVLPVPAGPSPPAEELALLRTTCTREGCHLVLVRS